jgi:hypothetical protein
MQQAVGADGASAQGGAQQGEHGKGEQAVMNE